MCYLSGCFQMAQVLIQDIKALIVAGHFEQGRSRYEDCESSFLHLPFVALFS